MLKVGIMLAVIVLLGVLASILEHEDS